MSVTFEQLIEEPFAVVFPGQGAQQPGMGLAWRDAEAWQLVSELSEGSGQDIAELLLTRSADDLKRTDLAQLSVFAASLIAWRHLSSVVGLPVPAAFAGHSLGEYTALVAAGALPIRDGARLVAARGAAMREAANATDGAMAAVIGAPLDEVAELVEDQRVAGHALWIANLNSPLQTVVAGAAKAVAVCEEEGYQRGLQVIRLPVAGAFHTELMSAAGEPLRQALAEAAFAPAHAPVVANVDARVHRSGGDWAELLPRQLVSAVLWEGVVRTLTDELGCTAVIEVGPGRTLSNLTARIRPGVRTLSVDALSAAGRVA